MSRRPGTAAALLVAAALLLPALTGCDAEGAGGDSADAGQAEGAADAALAEPSAVELRDGIQAAPGTRVLGDGAGSTQAGWYAALDLGDAAPREVAEFYREHLTDLGFAVRSGTGPLTVVAERPEVGTAPQAGEPDGGQSLPGQREGPAAATRVRVDVVPRSGEVPGFVRLVAG